MKLSKHMQRMLDRAPDDWRPFRLQDHPDHGSRPDLTFDGLEKRGLIEVRFAEGNAVMGDILWRRKPR